MPTLRFLQKLPGIDELRRLLQSLAMLDALHCPEWEFRYYSFDSRWNKGESMGSMRNGEGDHFFVHFTRHGCFVKGFAHESPMAPVDDRAPEVWPGMFDGLPKVFSGSLREVAFDNEFTTFCFWRLIDDDGWRKGPVKYPARVPDPDGSRELLALLDGRPASYRRWAEDYYEMDVPLPPVKRVYAHEPLTNELVEELNPRPDWKELAKDVREISYPSELTRRSR